MLNKVSLHRNKHETGLCIDWLTKNIVTRGLQEPNPVFISSSKNDSVFTNSVFVVTLYTITTMNNDSQLYSYYSLFLRSSPSSIFSSTGKTCLSWLFSDSKWWSLQLQAHIIIAFCPVKEITHFE